MHNVHVHKRDIGSVAGLSFPVVDKLFVKFDRLLHFQVNLAVFINYVLRTIKHDFNRLVTYANVSLFFDMRPHILLCTIGFEFYDYMVFNYYYIFIRTMNLFAN